MEIIDEARHGSTGKRPFDTLDEADPPRYPETTTCKIGDNILAIRSDELWHKAKVLDINMHFVNVVYISSGETELIPSSLWDSRLSSRYDMEAYSKSTLLLAFRSD